MKKTKAARLCFMVLSMLLVFTAAPSLAEEESSNSASALELSAAGAAQMLRALASGKISDEGNIDLDVTRNGVVNGVDVGAILFFACGGISDWVSFGERVASGLCDERYFDRFSYTGTKNDLNGNYKSEDVSVTILRGRVSDSDYFLADIYIQDISCFVTAFGGEEFQGGTESVRKIFDTVPGGIVGMNGDFYSIDLHGPVIRNGQTYLNRVSGDWDIAALDSSGVLTVYPYGELKKSALKEMELYQTWVFGPSLLDSNGHAKTKFRSAVTPNNPRSVLGYYEPGHYAFLLVDGRSQTCDGITLEDLSTFCEELGFTSAYNLDGGQSSVLVSQQGVINDPFRGGRAVSDILAIRELPVG